MFTLTKYHVPGGNRRQHASLVPAACVRFSHVRHDPHHCGRGSRGWDDYGSDYDYDYNTPSGQMHRFFAKMAGRGIDLGDNVLADTWA